MQSDCHLATTADSLEARYIASYMLVTMGIFNVILAVYAPRRIFGKDGLGAQVFCICRGDLS